MAMKVVPRLSTIETMLDDVDEYARNVLELRRRLKRLKPGSSAYHDLLPDLSVQLDVLSLKVEHAAQTLEAYQESLPEEPA
jgi:chromosome segregation ATPase